MNGNLAGLLTDAVQRYSERPALRSDQAVYSYAALNDASGRVARLLRGRGIGPGDRVGIMLPNGPYFPVVYYGVLRAGAIAVPMNVLLKEREVAFYLSDPEAHLMFAWHGFADQALAGAAQAGAEAVVVGPGAFETLLAGSGPVPGVAERADTDTAVILYTSGTTGTPKGAELTHANLRSNADVSRRLFTLGPDDVVAGALPLFHSFGQTCSLNATIACGSSLTQVARFDATKVLETIQRDRVTVFMGVPTMYSALLNHPDRKAYDTSSLRACVSGGAALPVEVLRGFEEAFGCVVLEGYGLSETSPVASFNHPHRVRKPGSIGTPVEGVQMKVVDEARQDLPRRRGGRDRDPGPQCDEGLLAPPGRDHRGALPRWLAPHRRHSPYRCRRDRMSRPRGSVAILLVTVPRGKAPDTVRAALSAGSAGRLNACEMRRWGELTPAWRPWLHSPSPRLAGRPEAAAIIISAPPEVPRQGVRDILQ